MSEEYNVPDGLYYSEEHEWVKVQEDGTVIIGVSDYAQKTLHDIVYVELPDAGSDAEYMGVIGALESVKAVSDMNSPISGEVLEVNNELLDSPDIINEDPYGKGWIAKMKPSNLQGDILKLMDAAAYKKHVAAQDH